MSHTKGFEMSIKDYAKQRNKTVQAVYQQMKRQENATALAGHVFLRRIGNKDVKYLDQEAVTILDEGSRSTPTVYMQDNLKDELDAAKAAMQSLRDEFMKQQGKIDLLKEELAQRDDKLRLLAEPEKQIEDLKGQNGLLSDEKKEWKGKAIQAEKNEQKANKEAWRQYYIALEFYNDLPWWKKRRRSAPVPPEVKE